MAKFSTSTQNLDKHLQVLNGEPSTKELHVTKVSKLQHLLGNRTKEVDTKYFLIKDDKKVEVDKSFISAIAKNKDVNVEPLYERVLKDNPGKSNIKLGRGKFHKLQLLTGTLFALGLVATAMLAFGLTTNKNFSGKITKLTEENINSVKAGEFVEFELPILDLYKIEVTETTTNYGIETSKTTKDGNQYVLSFAFLADDAPADAKGETFIYRYGPNSDVRTKVDAVIDEDLPYVELVQGEVKDLSKIEKLDSGLQVEEFFKESVDLYFKDEFNYADLFIDGNVSQADLGKTVLIISSAAAISLAMLMLVVIFTRKQNQYVRNYITDSKVNGPVNRG
jgi:hypothetical protein